MCGLCLLTGAQIGIVLTMPLAGFLCEYVNWDSVFYVTGQFDNTTIVRIIVIVIAVIVIVDVVIAVIVIVTVTVVVIVIISLIIIFVIIITIRPVPRTRQLGKCFFSLQLTLVHETVYQVTPRLYRH